MRYTLEEREHRFATVLRLRDDDKLTFKEIGEAISVSGGRATQIYAKAMERKNFKYDADRELSARARYGIRNMMSRITRRWDGPITKQVVIDNQDRLRETRNIGKVTEDELRSWAGLPPIVTGPRGGFCPHCGEAI